MRIKESQHKSKEEESLKKLQARRIKRLEETMQMDLSQALLSRPGEEMKLVVLTQISDSCNYELLVVIRTCGPCLGLVLRSFT